jgi:hypothetical protein
MTYDAEVTPDDINATTTYLVRREERLTIGGVNSHIVTLVYTYLTWYEILSKRR